MDPTSSANAGLRFWIPRTRGDGPIEHSAVASTLEDSPHPRGWTLGGHRPDAPAHGFPAPAGMDPDGDDARSGGQRIPRTRGDGPAYLVRALAARADSPHPRGWTPELSRVHVLDEGFPAPAGMDLFSASCLSPPTWIPRTRGDGPQALPRVRRIEEDSPHPRGWTRGGAGGLVAVVGFPAPAGMDPSCGSKRRSSTRIPRTRGDGPYAFPAAGDLQLDSPHPRGWTRPRPQHLGRVVGFPAPAGMDPGRR